MDAELMTARHLEAFQALMTSTGLKEAAEKLNCSIPAISKAIGVLERQAQAPLFVRVGGRLQATAEALAFLPSAQSALNAMEVARRDLLQLATEKPPRLKVGVGGGALPYWVPEAIRRCREALPGLEVEMITHPTQKLLHLVATHQIDVAVATPPPHNTDANLLSLCAITPIQEAPLVAVVPAQHPLARRRVLRPQDLAGTPLITLYEKSPTVALVSAAFKESGEKLDIAIQVNNSISACYLVNIGAGVGLIHPEALAGGAFANLVKIDFLPRVSMTTFLYLPKVPVNAALSERFVRKLREVCGPQRTRKA
ncbi:MAG: LysR family transcriptional regulator [Pigmentiphaga sp.]|nr:LysR family transcriptional regulator [Pigmentiphaga sp.]